MLKPWCWRWKQEIPETKSDSSPEESLCHYTSRSEASPVTSAYTSHLLLLLNCASPWNLPSVCNRPETPSAHCQLEGSFQLERGFQGWYRRNEGRKEKREAQLWRVESSLSLSLLQWRRLPTALWIHCFCLFHCFLIYFVNLFFFFFINFLFHIKPTNVVELTFWFGISYSDFELNLVNNNLDLCKFVTIFKIYFGFDIVLIKTILSSYIFLRIWSKYLSSWIFQLFFRF